MERIKHREMRTTRTATAAMVIMVSGTQTAGCRAMNLEVG
jgi:hypothetical protein